MELGSWRTMKPRRSWAELKPIENPILCVCILTGQVLIDRLEEYGLACKPAPMPGPTEDPPEHTDIYVPEGGRPVRQAVLLRRGAA